MTRKKKTLLILLALVAALVLWIIWGNSAIQTTNITVTSNRLPSSFSGYTIVHISDLHNKEFGDGQSTLLSKISTAEPDLIAITGDLIDSRRTDIDTAMEFIEGAVKIAPVYYVTGNHESRISSYQELESRLIAAGVTVLADARVTLTRGEEQIALLGVVDPTFLPIENASYAVASNMVQRLEELRSDSQAFTILLSHRPELFDSYVQTGMDLVLSGHAHGGQIRIPLIGALIAPNQGLFPNYTSGLYQQSSTNMVVSRGLGNSLFPFRVNNRPELVVVTLSGAA